MAAVIGLLLVAVVLVGVVLLVGSEERERVALSFPPDLSAKQVETLLGTVAGLPARSRVLTEAVGHDGRVAFGLVAHPSDVASLRAGLQGFAPSVRLGEPAVEPDEPVRLRAHLGWRGSYVLLRRDEPELAIAALLGVLRSVGRDERLCLRLRLRPVVRPTAPPYRRERSRPWWERMTAPASSLPADQLRPVRSQYGGPLLNVRCEVRVWSDSRVRARQLLARVVAVLRARSGVRGRFFVRSHRLAVAGPGTLLAPPELVPLVGFPLAGPDLPGVSYVRSPQRLPDEAIPRRGGRCFGISTWPGMETRELHQPAVGALSHALLLGPSGSGKSSLLVRLLLDQVALGQGVVLLDMKGDSVLDVLERVPAARQDDVVVLDPADTRPVPGLKGLDARSPDLAADLWVGLFRNLFPDAWGVRSDRYVRLGVQTLALDGGASITELPRIFSDASFRRRLLAKSRDPLLQSAWASFESLSASQQAEHLAAPLGKVQDVLGRQVVRGVLGQTKPKMTITRAMRERRIVVVRLSPGALGPPTADLLGGLVIYEVYQAVMARQAVAPEARVPFGVYVDEPAVMRLAGVPLDSLYELARGMGVGITTATQSVVQLPPAVQHSVLTNAATIATFRTGYRDAGIMAREFPGIEPEQLQHLGQFEIVLRLGLRHGQVTAPLTARTLPPPEPCSEPDALRDRAAERYGVALEETDAALQARWTDRTAADVDAPIGRRRTS